LRAFRALRSGADSDAAVCVAAGGLLPLELASLLALSFSGEGGMAGELEEGAGLVAETRGMLSDWRNMAADDATDDDDDEDDGSSDGEGCAPGDAGEGGAVALRGTELPRPVDVAIKLVGSSTSDVPGTSHETFDDVGNERFVVAGLRGDPSLCADFNDDDGGCFLAPPSRSETSCDTLFAHFPIPLPFCFRVGDVVSVDVLPPALVFPLAVGGAIPADTPTFFFGA